MGAWPSLEIQRLERSFRAYASLVHSQAFVAEDEVVAALSKFLVVRSCGYIEQVSEASGRAYLLAKSSPRTAAFGASWLGRGRTPTPGNLVDFVGKFDTKWADDLTALLDSDDARLSREMSFLVDRRIKIAHGMNEGLGASKAGQLSEVAIEVADWFIAKFDPR